MSGTVAPGVSGPEHIPLLFFRPLTLVAIYPGDVTRPHWTPEEVVSDNDESTPTVAPAQMHRPGRPKGASGGSSSRGSVPSNTSESEQSTIVDMKCSTSSASASSMQNAVVVTSP
eukprot:2471300-Rhodomonas_salina.2